MIDTMTGQSVPGALISPQVDGTSSAMRDKITRLLNGEPLASVVTTAEGPKGIS